MKDVLLILEGSEPVLGGDYCCSALFVCFAFVVAFPVAIHGYRQPSIVGV